MAAREAAGDGATEVPGARPHLEHHGGVGEMQAVGQGLGREDKPAQRRDEQPGELVGVDPATGQPPEQGRAFAQLHRPCASGPAMSALDPSTVAVEGEPVLTISGSWPPPFGVGRGSASDRADCPVCLAALPPRGHREEGDHWTEAEAVTLWV